MDKPSTVLQKLQEIDFALYETVLYLDAYPDDRDALEYYLSLLPMRAKLAAEYESRYAPITAFSSRGNASWDWVKAPWPWQYEAN